MCTYRLAVLVFLLTSTCGAPEPTDEPIATLRSALNKSGTRIQIRRTVTTRTTSDGSSYDVDNGVVAYDSKFGVWCEPQATSDGILRCLPYERASIGDNFYTDITCSVRLAFSFGCSIPKFASEVSYSDPLFCGNDKVLFYPILSEVKGIHHFSKYGTTCSDGGPIPPYYHVFKVGPVMSPTDFVATTVTSAITILP